MAWDGKSSNGWLQAAEGAAAIVNLAGENLSTGRWTGRIKENIRMSRINAGRAAAEAVERCKKKPSVVIQASATGYYGDRGSEEITESSASGKGFLADVCRAWEDSSKSVETQGVRRAVIRTGVVLGAEGGMIPRLLLPFRLFMGGIPGGGRPWLSWIHLRDEVRAIRFLIETRRASGVFNLTAPAPVISGEFYRTLGALLRRPVWAPMPAFALRLILGELADEMILSGQRVLPEKLLKLGFEFEFPELEGALADIINSNSISIR